MSFKLSKYINGVTLTIALAAALAVAIIVGMNLRSKLSAVRSELASSKVLYSIITKEKVRLDSLIGFYVHSIGARDSVIAIKDREILKRLASIAVLENKLKNLQGTLDNVTADSSYNYINRRVIPIAEQKYKFDSIQVSTIHYNFLERDDLKELNLFNTLFIEELIKTETLKSTQIRDLKELNSLMLSKEAILKKEQESNQLAIEGLNKNIKQQRRQKNWIIGGTAGVAAIIIIKSIAK